MKRTILTLVVYGFVVLCIGFTQILLSGAALAQENQENKEKNIEVTMKELTGVISALSPSFIAIETGVDAQQGAATEAAFNLSKNVRIEHKNSLKEIKVGDIVTVGYEETIETRDDGRKMRKTSVKTITFLKPAPAEMTALEETTPPGEGDAKGDSLPLKGLKER